MHRRAALLTASVALAVPRLARAAEVAPVLVELFTSQGCSSCPPADAAFARLLGRPDVLALAFHVTYWDRLGWRDTLGDPQFTERQRWYSGVLGKGLYTPQIVVAGELDLVGSDPRLAQALTLARTRRTPGTIEITSSGILLPAVAATGDVRLLAAWYDRQHSVAIERGENAGEVVDYRNTVRVLRDLGPWDGTARRMAIPTAGQGTGGLAVLAQDQVTGGILAIGGRETNLDPSRQTETL